jgi:hypothetical protein
LQSKFSSRRDWVPPVLSFEELADRGVERFLARRVTRVLVMQPIRPTGPRVAFAPTSTSTAPDAGSAQGRQAEDVAATRTAQSGQAPSESYPRPRAASPLLALAARRTSPAAVQTHHADIELAAYVLARAVTDRPLTSAQLEGLKRANESKKEVLEIMQYGRSNVESDVRATDNEAVNRLRALRKVIRSQPSVGQSALQSNMSSAAATALAGTGCCDEFANLSLYVHAGRLRDGEQATLQFVDDKIDHAWVTHRGVPDEQGAVPTAVLDFWGDGPVIDVADSIFESGDEGTVQTRDGGRIDGSVGAQWRDSFDEWRDPEQAGNKTERRLKNQMLAETRNPMPVPEGDLFGPTPIVCPTFAEEARAAIDAMTRPELVDQVIKAALSVFGESISRTTAQELTDEVIAVGRDLRSATPRNLIARRGTGEASAGGDTAAPAPPEAGEPSVQRRRLA